MLDDSSSDIKSVSGLQAITSWFSFLRCFLIVEDYFGYGCTIMELQQLYLSLKPTHCVAQEGVEVYYDLISGHPTPINLISKPLHEVD